MFLSLMGLVFNMKWNLVHVLCIFLCLSLRIQNFQKKTDACNVSLVLNTQGLEGVFPGGYHCPGRLVETPKGLNSFPTIFSYPGVCQSSSAYTSNAQSHLICFPSYIKWHSLFKFSTTKKFPSWHQHSRPYSDFWGVNFNTKKIDTEEPVISFLMLNIFLKYFDFLIFPSRRGQPIIFLQWWWCWPRVAMTQRPTPRTRLTSCTTRGRIPPTSTHRWMSASAWWSYSRARNPKKTPTLITLWMT